MPFTSTPRIESGRAPSGHQSQPLNGAASGPPLRFGSDQIDAYMTSGEVADHLQDPISLEPLRAPIHVSARSPAYSQRTIEEWVEKSHTSQDPTTAEQITDAHTRRDSEISLQLRGLRFAAEKTWLARGDKERAWATRWLRLHLQKIESKPLDPLPRPANPTALAQRELTVALLELAGLNGRLIRVGERLVHGQNKRFQFVALAELLMHATIVVGCAAYRSQTQVGPEGRNFSASAGLGPLVAAFIGAQIQSFRLSPRGETESRFLEIIASTAIWVGLMNFNTHPQPVQSFVAMAGPHIGSLVSGRRAVAAYEIFKKTLRTRH